MGYSDFTRFITQWSFFGFVLHHDLYPERGVNIERPVRAGGENPLLTK